MTDQPSITSTVEGKRTTFTIKLKVTDAPHTVVPGRIMEPTSVRLRWDCAEGREELLGAEIFGPSVTTYGNDGKQTSATFLYPDLVPEWVAELAAQYRDQVLVTAPGSTAGEVIEDGGERPGTTTATYDRVIDCIKRQVAKLNEALGLPADEGATFGYIGGIDGLRDDRKYYVFLPHPGRMGTSTDLVGGFAHGDEAGARALACTLGGMLTLARWRNS